MKNITLEITPEFLTKHTVSSTSVTGFHCAGLEVASCAVPHHLTAFPQTAVQMYSLLCNNNSGIDFRVIKTSKEKFILNNIKSNPENVEIFSIFRKFGILTGVLNIGVSGTPSNPKLYTTAKMMRDLSKYPLDVQIALAATLYNIAKVVSVVITSNPHIEVSTLTHTVRTDLPLEKVIVDFSTVKTITVAETPIDDYNSIEYYNRKYCAPYTSYTNPIYYEVLAAQKDESFSFAKAHILTSVNFGPTVYPILICPNAKIYTTLELSNFEAARDSYISALSANFHDTIVSVEKHTLEEIIKEIGTSNILCDIIGDDDLTELFEAEAAPSLVGWCRNVKANPHDNLGDVERTSLVTVCKLSEVGASSVLDQEAMKELYKTDEYAQQLYKQVKPYYESFDLGKLSANIRGFAKGDIYSMMFIGSSGTGKSTSARVIPARCGIPYVSVNLSVNIEESDIVGSMVPNVYKSKPEDPEFVWQDGVLTKAVRNGYCIILEEINFARPGVLGKLNSLLDENRQIDLPTGEVLVAHPNFRIIATCNVAYEGTNRFNRALVNRFEDCTIFKDVTRAKAIEIIKERTGYKNITKMDVILNVYEALKKYSKEQNLNLVVSIRQLLNIFTNGKYYSDAHDAVVRIMVNGAFIEEPEYQEEFEKSVLPAFKLNYKL